MHSFHSIEMHWHFISSTSCNELHLTIYWTVKHLPENNFSTMRVQAKQNEKIFVMHFLHWKIASVDNLSSQSLPISFIFSIDYFSHGGTNDNGRYFWHTEIPATASIRQHRLSDTGKWEWMHGHWMKLSGFFIALPTPTSTESTRSTSVSSSISTEFSPTNNNQMTVPTSPHARRNNRQYSLFNRSSFSMKISF